MRADSMTLPRHRAPLVASARGVILAGGLIVVAAVAAYHNAFAAAFVFDDASAILKNPTIRHLWPVWDTLSPPVTGGGVCGRPLVNFSFAVNYAISGTNVWSYHLLNLIIHVLAGLTLFGVVRRTLGQPVLRERFGADALPLAAVAALLWTVHPLQTESVTFVVQRNEALVGLFYLLTLYGLIRSHETPTPEHVLPWTGDLLAQGVAASASERTANVGPTRPFDKLRAPSLPRGWRWWPRGMRWFVAFDAGPPALARPLRSGFARSGACWVAVSVVACLLGAASKEVIVTAPVVALLYDRTFLAGSFREAWRRRWALYAGLAGSWILLGFLMAGSAKRDGTVGFGLGVSSWDYALTQCRAIVMYLQLCVWPHPLVLDYGTSVVHSAGEVWPQATAVLALLGIAIWALVKTPRIGFLAAAFFAILAPSSSVVPLISQTMAEHRLYLPLATVVLAAVCGLHALIGRRSLSLGLVLAGALALLTLLRNEAYRTELSLWSDTVAKRPANARAHFNLGQSLLVLRRLPEARTQFEEALQIQPNFADAHNNLGNALFLAGHMADAEVHYRAALRLQPDSAEIHNNVGNVLLMSGNTEAAVAEYAQVLRIDPGYIKARNNLGYALRFLGRTPEAIAQFEEVLRTVPDSAEAHNNLGETLLLLGRRTEAAQQFDLALRFQPDYAKARSNLEGMNQ